MPESPVVSYAQCLPVLDAFLGSGDASGRPERVFRVDAAEERVSKPFRGFYAYPA